MEGFVAELVSLVNGGANGTKKASYANVKASTEKRTRIPSVSLKKDYSEDVPAGKLNEVTPEQVIAIEEEEFNDFSKNLYGKV